MDFPTNPQILDSHLPRAGALMITGGYGTGKTEVSVNLALTLAHLGRTVRIIDLDIVNPYFRCRETRSLLEQQGIKVIVPRGALADADLPVILPEIAGLFRSPGPVINLFDVGGDDLGARVLSSFAPIIGDKPYELWQVINSRRPFSDTVAGCMAMRNAIEASSRLRVTGLLANTHLIHETTPQIIMEGRQLTCDLSASSGLPIRLVAVMEEFADEASLDAVTEPILWLKRNMLPPWMMPGKSSRDSASAPGRRPIGVPGPIMVGS